MLTSSGLAPSSNDNGWVSAVGGGNIPENRIYPGTASNNLTIPGNDHKPY